MMGTDPKKSVTNSYGQCWDMKNLFITDGATLVLQRRQESDAHHHGAGVALGGSHAGPHEEEGTVTGPTNHHQVDDAAAAAVQSLQLHAGDAAARDVAAGPGRAMAPIRTW